VGEPSLTSVDPFVPKGTAKTFFCGNRWQTTYRGSKSQ